MVDSRTNQVEGATFILDQLLRDRAGYERKVAQRVMVEVTRSWPGDVNRLWWKWFIEASASLNLRCKTLDCSVEEAIRLAEDGAQLILHQESPQAEWLSIRLVKPARFEVLRAAEERQSRTVRIRRVRRTLSSIAQDGVVRCVVVHPHPHVKALAEHVTHASPLQRYWDFMRPEWSDIWVIGTFALINGLLVLATPIAVETLVNTVAFGRYLQPVVILSLILFVFLGFNAGISALKAYVAEIVQQRMFARVVGDLAYRLPHAEVEQTDGEYVPELVNRFFDVVTVQKVSAKLLLDGISMVLATIVGMAVLAFYHPWLLGFDILLLGLILFIVFVLGRGAIGTAIYESKQKYYSAAWLEDIARNPITFRNEGGNEYALDRADYFAHKYLTARQAHWRILIRQIMFSLALQAVASTVLLGLGGWLVITGELTLGQLVAAELIVSAILGTFAKLGSYMESFYDMMAGVDKLSVLFDLKIERRDGSLDVICSDAEDAGANSLELNGTTYTWLKSKGGISGVSCVVPRSSSLAVFGGSGSGKSTLLDLIYGLREPTGGYVSIDGVDPRDVRPDRLREHMAMVRGVEVFHASVEDNVHLNRPNVSSLMVREVLEQVGLLSVVDRLKDGPSTVLASSGAPLTESQCRALSIARAIAGKPRMILIDAVLDALPDQECEQLLSMLLAPEHTWTVVIATGRQSIADRCDKILDLKIHSKHVKS